MRWLTARTARSPVEVEDRALTRETVPAAFLPVGTGMPVGADAALRIADVFACVRALADAAASLPLVAYRRTPDGRERFTGRLADLIARPAPATTTANLIGTLVAHLNLHGSAFLGLYRDAEGTVMQLAPLEPTAITVSLEAGEPVYTMLRAGGVQRLTRRDVIHIRGLSVDGLVGLSPIRQARQALNLADSLAGHAESFARNAGRPGGILRVSDPMGTAADAAALKDQWGTLFSGDRSGQVAVISGDTVDYQQLALSMADAEFVAQRQLSTAEIARIFRVPPSIIGAPSGDSLTYSTVEGQALAFVKFALTPWLTVIEQAISAHPDLSPGSVYVEFLLEGLLRGESKTRAEVYALALDPERGWMTRREIRSLENLPAEPDRPAIPDPEEAPRARIA